MHATADMTDRPFGAPIEAVLFLPPSPSVNASRRYDFGHLASHREWIRQADITVLANGGLRALPKMPGKFEALLVIDEHLNRLDLDNAIKAVIDYARRIELVINDDKRYFRKLTVEWGHAPSGCRLHLRSIV
jgi:hypothetical protein